MGEIKGLAVSVAFVVAMVAIIALAPREADGRARFIKNGYDEVYTCVLTDTKTDKEYLVVVGGMYGHYSTGVVAMD